MATITKEDIQKAFKSRNRGRNLLLYQYYREEYFSSKLYTSVFIADKISEDLGVLITAEMVRQVKSRTSKKFDTNDTPPLSPKKGDQDVPKGNEHGLQDKVQKAEEPKLIFRNADDIPEKDPMVEAFARLKAKGKNNPQ